MRLRLISVFPWVWCCAVVATVRAQEPLNAPVPLAIGAPPAASAGGVAVKLSAAQRALELGFPATAAEIYRGLLTTPGTEQRTVTLALAAALIADGRPAEAERLLANFKDSLKGHQGAEGAAWHLYAGLAAVQLKRPDLARGELPAVREKEGELTPEERSWWLYLQGLLAETGEDRAGAVQRAKNFYQQAVGAATTVVARTRFQIAELDSQLRLGAISAPELEQARRVMEQRQGTEPGYIAARTYAVGLNVAGRKDEAVAVLRQLLLGLSPQERARADDFRLLLGLIAGAADGVGRNELLQLLTSGRDADRQRMALQLLAEKSAQEPARAELRSVLTRLLGATPPHPIAENLLLYRANFSLAEKNFGAAEEDARALLEKFPGSTLKPLALAVLTSSSWEQRRYRTVVDSAARAAEAQSAESPSGRKARAELRLLVAEAWFRAGDFRNAADAYAVVLRDLPPGAEAGKLMFQRVQAEIEAGAPEAAQPVLDELARNPAFDAENRWQAEWNLARALLGRGTPETAAAAYARVNRLLAGQAPGLTPELRARMKWLQARLAFDTGDPQRTLEIATKELTPLLAGLAPALNAEIASSAALLKARASFALNDETAALATLKKLRADFPRTEAVVSSYIAEANHYAEQERTVEAQQLFVKLADEFPKDELAPYALFQAALQAERRGQNLEEANKRIDDLLKTYPNSSLFFAARLKQGDLLRRLNQFPQAQRAYESLLNTFASRPDVVLAQLALAECHNAQSANDPGHAETALAWFERVRERVDAPVDVRVEAGYNRGMVLARRGDTEKAAAAWWLDVVTPFLLEPGAAAKLESKGRWWMARTLLELGALREQQGKLEEAKQAWLKILEAKLPGEALARGRLAPYGVTEAKP